MDAALRRGGNSGNPGGAGSGGNGDAAVGGADAAVGGADAAVGGVDAAVDSGNPDAGEAPTDDCDGAWIHEPVGGEGPQPLRSNVTVRALFAIPGDVTRIARHPVSHVLHLLTQTGSVRSVDLQAGTTRVVFTPEQLLTPAGDEALGMAFATDGTLYVVTHATQAASPTTCRARIVRAVPEPNETHSFELFAASADYPRSNTYFDHEWSGIAVSPDDEDIYVNCGSRTDHGEVQSSMGAFPDAREAPLTARVLRLPAHALTPLEIPNDEPMLELNGWVFARGIRNSFDLEFAPNGDLLAPDNGPDGDYHEELNWLRQGHHYGFPWRLGNQRNAMADSPYDASSDVRLQEVYGARFDHWHDDPQFPSDTGLTFTEPILNHGPDADQFRDVATGGVLDASAREQPYATFSDHGSPLGLTFDPGEGALCGDFSGKAFMLRFGVGTETNDFEVGRDLLLLDLVKSADSYALSARRLVSGFTAPIDAVLVGHTLYVADRSAYGDGTGMLYAIDLPHPDSTALPRPPTVSGSRLAVPAR